MRQLVSDRPGGESVDVQAGGFAVTQAVNVRSLLVQWSPGKATG